jgi:tetratricopeptide (TPR) repeat protein
MRSESQIVAFVLIRPSSGRRSIGAAHGGVSKKNIYPDPDNFSSQEKRQNMSNLLERFEAQLAEGNDSALLRLSIAQQLSTAGRFDDAIGHLQRALLLNPAYTAVWSALGSAFEKRGDPERAIQTYKSGVETARKNGDKQAERQMGVFLNRLNKGRPD